MTAQSTSYVLTSHVLFVLPPKTPKAIWHTFHPSCHQAALAYSRLVARRLDSLLSSNRSRFMTLSHAAIKSFTNL